MSEAERELEAIRAKMARGELDPERKMEVSILVTRFNVGPLVSSVEFDTPLVVGNGEAIQFDYERRLARIVPATVTPDLPPGFDLGEVVE